MGIYFKSNFGPGVVGEYHDITIKITGAGQFYANGIDGTFEKYTDLERAIDKMLAVPYVPVPVIVTVYSFGGARDAKKNREAMATRPHDGKRIWIKWPTGKRETVSDYCLDTPKNREKLAQIDAMREQARKLQDEADLLAATLDKNIEFKKKGSEA